MKASYKKLWKLCVLIVALIVIINGLTNSRIDIRRDLYEKGII